MHLAYPSPADAKSHSDGNGKWKMRRADRLSSKLIGGVVAALILLYIGLTNPLQWSKTYYTGGIKTNAVTLEISKSAYIYPDLKDLAGYQSSGTVPTRDNKKVASKTHSIIYGGSDPLKLVLVVGLDAEYPQAYLEDVLKDRLDYAKKHGYGLYARYLQDFEAETVGSAGPNTNFSKVMLLREAMYSFRNAQWLWWLDQDAVIMEHNYSIEEELLTPSRLNSKMTRDAPILPPESIIHTYKRVPAANIKFIITQNDRGMSASSFLVHNDELYGRVLMGYWSDPLHRSYAGFNSWSGYQGQLDASLSHMVQWHPAILSKMAVVPHKYLGSRPNEGAVLKGQKYEKGAFVFLVRDSNEMVSPGVDKIVAEWKAAKEKAGKS